MLRVRRKGMRIMSDPKETAKRHPALIILSALLDGHGVSIKGEEWWYQDGIFGLRRQRWENGVRQDDVLIEVEMTVGGFIRWCEKLPPETISQVVFSTVVAKERVRRF